MVFITDAWRHTVHQYDATAATTHILITGFDLSRTVGSELGSGHTQRATLRRRGRVKRRESR